MTWYAANGFEPILFARLVKLICSVGGENMPKHPGSSEDHNSLDGFTSEGVASLESILCTEELHRRPTRTPDYDKESRALVALAHALADSPRSIFQTLADKILE